MVTQQEAGEARVGSFPGSDGWEDEEATEDTVCLGTLVYAALTGVFFNPDLVSML